ncbi:MAG: hypothetical protein ACI9G1_001890 [Pirellulaceae bacterium]|jgi:hypothetical protein
MAIMTGRQFTEEAVDSIRKVCLRSKDERQRVEHPVLGKLTAEQWDNFNWPHAELHMSFVHPGQ